ncbi:hypothetical protein CLCR_07716 [Cladophialophora carrionii]|uniref:Uncharacterized protein n=1 Tax=Cladophialophora carrionii TaxID=86049 RepID=A0A1C1CN80_9EURO|nr:hypothetical protein CLCR_07716 [Cladophialophora carrionii]
MANRAELMTCTSYSYETLAELTVARDTSAFVASHGDSSAEVDGKHWSQVSDGISHSTKPAVLFLVSHQTPDLSSGPTATRPLQQPPKDSADVSRQHRNHMRKDSRRGAKVRRTRESIATLWTPDLNLRTQPKDWIHGLRQLNGTDLSETSTK